MLGFTPQKTGELNRQATNHVTNAHRKAQPKNEPVQIQVTEEYLTVKKLIDANVPIIFVTGGAGTGKSTFINYIRNNLKKSVVVLAPTGVAALNVQGATIHSYFRFPPHILNREDIKKVQDQKLYSHLDVLILDEVSMIRADVIDAIDTFLRINGKDSQRPFGGTQVIMVGDLFQLPPVVGTKEESTLFMRKYSSPFFFSSKVLNDQVIAPVELKKVFRQKDQNFVDILNRLRLGDSSDEVLSTINMRLSAPRPADPPIVLTVTNSRADSINTAGINLLSGEVREYEGTISGKLNIEEDKLPSPLHLRLKFNARVMFTKNDKDRRWINGTFGIVIAMKPDSIIVALEGISDDIVSVQQVSWETYKYIYDEENDKIVPKVTGSYKQFPLVPAWATTIHKSQGKTLPTVMIDLGNGAFAPGQTYVALSRVRRLEDVWLGRAVKKSDVHCDQSVRNFYANLFNCPLDYGLPPSSQSVESSTASSKASSTQSTFSTRQMVEAAMDSGDSLEIKYTDLSGNTTNRHIRPRNWVDNDRFTAFCDLRQAERDFRVSRISACHLVD